MFMQMRSKRRYRPYPPGPPVKLRPRDIVVLVAALFLAVGGMAVAWREGQKAARTFEARHGKCLKWTVVRHVPIHHERCDQWEKP